MRLTLKQIRQVILGVVIAGVIFSGGYSLGQKKTSSGERALNPHKYSQVDLGLFWKVWDRVESAYLDREKIDPDKMVYGAISGMVASLSDPYTVFLPPSDNKEAKDDLRGDFEGVGIQIGYNKDKRISVIAPLAGTPAEAAGLKSGDVILKIVDEENGVDQETSTLALPDAVRLIRGPKGSMVKLTIGREGKEKSFEVGLKRATIVVKSVEVKIKERNNRKIAVIQLSRFGERTYDEWNDAVTNIKKQIVNSKEFDGIILDLRNNPGGFLQGAVFIGSEFLSSGVIVQQDRGEGGQESYSVNRKGSLLDEPLVVLVNGGSASASEIVAGALKEKGRAKLVGEKTFGKGTVQEAEDLEGGAGLHVTVARWLLPSGASIDKEGVAPDFEVKPDENDETKDLQLEKALSLLLTDFTK